MEPLDIAQRAGHEKIQTTLDTYGHLYPDKSFGIADLMEEDRARERKGDSDAGKA